MPDIIPETIPTETLTRADGSHDPFTGSHSHAHPALDSQGDDSTHEHEHSHDGDADHGHGHEERATEHTERAAVTGATPDQFSLSFPIVRFDEKTRLVYGRATVEEPDRHGTIFSYEGAKGAFKRWKGNVREQHDPKKAVGKRVSYECDDTEKGVYLTTRCSDAAQDTWTKLLEGVLADYSVSVIPAPEYGNDPRKWPKMEYQGRSYPYLPEYDYAEISYVDNGSAPGASLTLLARADGECTDVITALEDEPAETPVITLEQQQEEVQRAGATIRAATKNKLHDSIGHTLMAAKSQMQNCAESGCADCAAAVQTLDPDNDGDIDAFGGAFGDTDGDAATLSDDGDSDMARAVTELVERVVTAQLTPVYARLQGIAGTLARSNPNTNIEALITGAITRAVDAATSANATSLDEVRTELSVVKGQVATIANQPMPGPPIQHAGAVPRSPGKHLPTDQFQSQRRSGSAVFDALSEMSDRGDLNTVKLQEDAAYAHLLAQRGGR